MTTTVTTAIQIVSTNVVTQAGGRLYRCQHASTTLSCDMIFALFLPRQDPAHVLYFLSGLTCTDQNFATKAAGAFGAAEEKNLALVLPDTSPRGEAVPNDDKYDLGQGAGFYINAVQEPWKKHYQMESYVTQELPVAVQAALTTMGRSTVQFTATGITGHSMGGHGALTLAMKYPHLYQSVSALAPICHPTACPWGQKAFGAYLGSDVSAVAHDATELLLQNNKPTPFDDILIDQGTDDEFLAEQLRLNDFEQAAEKVGQKVTVRRHEGMDHSYYFIAACIADHIEFHAKRLVGK